MKIKNNVAISESGFVFDSNTGDSFSLNPTGIDITNLMKKEASMEEIKNFLFNKYEIDEQEVEKEILDFFNLLKQYQLIEEDE